MQREIAPVFLRELHLSAVHVVKLFARSRPEICRDVNKLTERCVILQALILAARIKSGLISESDNFYE